MLNWDSQRNPYTENIFVKADIPTHEINRKRLEVLLDAASLTDRREELLEAGKRFAHELLAHRTHEASRGLLKKYLSEFGQPPKFLGEPVDLETALIDPTNFVPLPEKGCEPETPKINFRLPEMDDDGDMTDDITLER